MGNSAWDSPQLPPGIVAEVEQIHAGRLWAWTIKETDDAVRLAVAIANLPGQRAVNAVSFVDRDDAEAAAFLHNNQRGLSATEARRIVDSVAEAETAFMADQA